MGLEGVLGEHLGDAERELQGCMWGVAGGGSEGPCGGLEGVTRDACGGWREVHMGCMKGLEGPMTGRCGAECDHQVLGWKGL